MPRHGLSDQWRSHGSILVIGVSGWFVVEVAILHLDLTQGKIERWHQTLKNRIMLENDYPDGEFEAAIVDDDVARRTKRSGWMVRSGRSVSGRLRRAFP